MTHVAARTAARPESRLAAAVLASLPVFGMTAGMIAAACLRARLPFTPVPVTLQTLVVLLGSALFGGRRGAAAQGLYLGLGAIGAPVLAGGAYGLAAMAGPTGGYLVGFLLAAALVGRLLGGRPASWRRVVAVMAAGEIVILGCGAAYLMILGFAPANAVAAGVAPFAVWEAVKVAIAVVSYRLLVPPRP